LFGDPLISSSFFTLFLKPLKTELLFLKGNFFLKERERKGKEEKEVIEQRTKKKPHVR